MSAMSAMSTLFLWSTVLTMKSTRISLGHTFSTFSHFNWVGIGGWDVLDVLDVRDVHSFFSLKLS